MGFTLEKLNIFMELLISELFKQVIKNNEI